MVRLTDAQLAELTAIAGPEHVLTDPDLVAPRVTAGRGTMFT
jgi:hypothetical protein